MAIKLSKIKAETRSLPPIMYGTDSLNVLFYTNVYTPRFEEEAQRRRDSGVETTAGEAMGSMVVPLLASWDMSDDFEVGNVEQTEIPMISMGDDTKEFLTPIMDTWPFYYEDLSTGKLVEGVKQRIVEVYQARHICLIEKFVPLLEAGEPVMHEHIVPITITGLSNVPMVVMTDVIKRIGEEMTPGEEKSSSSEESSFME